jgi:hypothetical protein
MQQFNGYNGSVSIRENEMVGKECVQVVSLRHPVISPQRTVHLPVSMQTTYVQCFKQQNIVTM